MKNTKIGMWAIAVTTAALFAFRPFAGTVKGMVTPPNGAIRAWVLSATDTTRADVINGVFEITNVKPGTYRLIIEAKAPYKNQAKDGINVTDAGTVDVGEIKLEQ